MESSSRYSEMFSITSMNSVESCSFAGPIIIDTGSELQSTATCIFVPDILLNPSYPVTSPLFWLQQLTNQPIPFAVRIFPEWCADFIASDKIFCQIPFAAISAI